MNITKDRIRINGHLNQEEFDYLEEACEKYRLSKSALLREIIKHFKEEKIELKTK